MREIRLSGSTSGDWKRGPIKGLPRQSSTLLIELPEPGLQHIEVNS
jgi:hypothetical protein